MENNPLHNPLISFIDNENSVIGLVVAGSCAKGLQTSSSDLDLYIIVKENTDNDAIDELQKSILNSKYKKLNIDITNNAIQTLRSFEGYASIGTKSEWDRYNLLHTKTIIDKTNGDLQKILSQKSALDAKEAKTVINNHLGAYINLSYRSLKSILGGKSNESLLDAAESLEYMLSCLFALDSRVRPFNKYLKWELNKNKLDHSEQSATDTYELIVNYAKAEPDAHKKIFQMIKNKALSQGFGKTYDAWGNKLSVFNLGK